MTTTSPSIVAWAVAGMLAVFSSPAGASQPVRVGFYGTHKGVTSPSGVRTFIDVAIGVARDGTVGTATFGWSAAPCLAAVKIKFFRPTGPGFPSPGLTFLTERGPFDVTEHVQLENSYLPPVTQTVALHPAVALRKGDVVAITNTTSCGSPTFAGLPSGGIPPLVGSVSFPGDVTSSVTTADLPRQLLVSVAAFGRVLNQWTRLGPDVPISSVAAASGAILAGVGVRDCDTCPGGLFRSPDDGNTWSDVFPGGPTDAIAVALSNGSVVYAVRRGAGNPVWKSVDAGFTWTPTALTGVRVSVLRVDPSSPFSVWAGGDTGVFHTFDGGATWAHELDRPSIVSLAVSASQPTTVFAGSSSYGAFRTRDGGRTWASLPGLGVPTIPIGILAIRVESLAVDPLDSNLVIASMQLDLRGLGQPPQSPRVYRSLDGGESWLTVFDLGGILVAAPTSPSTFYLAAFDGLYRSGDGGSSWTQLTTQTPRIFDLAVDLEDPSTLYAATEDGVFRLTADPSTATLASGRFEARVVWRTPAGAGTATFVPLTDNAAAFWFFTPNNLELAVKVVDGQAANGHFWVFGAALTNVEYDLAITDTESGAVWTHHSPAGTLASFADTTAF